MTVILLRWLLTYNLAHVASLSLLLVNRTFLPSLSFHSSLTLSTSLDLSHVSLHRGVGEQEVGDHGSAWNTVQQSGEVQRISSNQGSQSSLMKERAPPSRVISCD
ncbi:hypothetical protein ONS96_004206 [Cadophora gregata f. sp. sojae]|nr:hypothetical protein ONS96_004206 [Cadophora gregata f. sp. sojae]